MLEAKTYLWITGSVCCALMLFSLLFCQFQVVAYWLIIQQSLSVLSIFAALLLIQRIFLLTIAIDFHLQTYQDRIKKSKAAIAILDNLSMAINVTSLNGIFHLKPNALFAFNKLSKRKSSPTAPLSAVPNSPIHDLPGPELKGSRLASPEIQSEIEDENDTRDSVQESLDTNQGFMRGLQFGGWNRISLDLLSDINAKQLAKRLYKSLSEQDFASGPQPVTIDSFSRYFPVNEECVKAFHLFDMNEHLTITLIDMKNAIVAIYRERKYLLKSLGDLSEALGALNRIMYIFSGLGTFFLSLPIIGITLSQILPITSLLFALSFIFGGSASTAFNCIIFIFVIHPFDSGDKIIVDGETYSVERFSLLNTVLVVSGGRKVYVPNGTITTNTSHSCHKIYP